jgi:hypothetical protein
MTGGSGAQRPRFLALEDATLCARSHFWSLGKTSLGLTRAVASFCQWRRRSSGGSLTRTVASLAARGTRRRDRRDPLSRREASLWPSRPPLGAKGTAFWLGGASLKLNRARVTQKDASLWLRGARLKPARARLSLAQRRIFEAQSDASDSERCISLAQRCAFRSRAIATAVDGRIVDAKATPKTNAKRVFGLRAAPFQARSRVSPPRMRIFEAQRCTKEAGRSLFLRKGRPP